MGLIKIGIILVVIIGFISLFYHYPLETIIGGAILLLIIIGRWLMEIEV